LAERFRARGIDAQHGVAVAPQAIGAGKENGACGGKVRVCIASSLSRTLFHVQVQTLGL
jgi:hypothetical protein